MEELRARALCLAELAAGRPEATAAARMAEQLRTGRFSIAVLGEFKRGKSTLVNALLGENVVPTGVLPLTAVATELSYGPRGASVEHVDGATRTIDPADVPGYVTEAANPGNEKKVARVVVQGEWPLLRGGVVLVDTPGSGSIHEHNTEAASAAGLDSDGAIVVLSADSPLSAAERDLLARLRQRRAPTFFVLNRADHLESGQLAQVRHFVEEALREHLGRRERIYSVDARAALASGRGGSGSVEVFDFPDLFGSLEAFIADDLVGALAARAAWTLAGLGRSLLDSLELEQAALEMGTDRMARLAEIFGEAAGRQMAHFEDDRTLLRRDSSELARLSRQRLGELAGAEAPRHFDELDTVASTCPAGELEGRLRGALEQAVQDSFEALRRAEGARLEMEWAEVAERFRARTEERVAAVRDAAAELFEVHLPRVAVPSVAARPESFFYLFLHVGSSSDLVTGLVGRLVPPPLARRRAVRGARDLLVREMAKHAGRAGWDLQQRLEAATTDLERAMQQEVESAIEAIRAAAGRAEEMRRAGVEERSRHRSGVEAQRRLALSLVDLAVP